MLRNSRSQQPVQTVPRPAPATVPFVYCYSLPSDQSGNVVVFTDVFQSNDDLQHLASLMTLQDTRGPERFTCSRFPSAREAQTARDEMMANVKLHGLAIYPMTFGAEQ
jgi:hypothetical protein